LNVSKWKGLESDPRKIGESTLVRPNVLPENRMNFQEGKTDKNGSRFLLPRIEAIHAGTTRNNTRYLADKLKGDPIAKSGVFSWLYPYPKPVIYNHDIGTEASGRVHNAAFSKETKAGREGIIVIPKITEEKAIQSILDGRLMTVSIGATTDSAICTVCGTDIIAEGWCGHQKGEIYDGVTAEWIIGQVWFDELSWVNVPADQSAMVVDAGEPQVAEAFASNGESFIDLSKRSTEWLVTQESLEANGLLGATDKKGDVGVQTVEELQAQVEQLTQQVTDLTAKKQTLTDELATANQTIAEKDTDLQAKDQTIVEKDQALAAKDTELVEANSAKEQAETKTVELQGTVDGLEVERQGLRDQNAELSSNIHKSTAERVVDLKIVLGKVANREEALAQHVTRTSESLNDSLVDLLVETVTVTPQRTPAPQVDNPANGALNDGLELNAPVDGKKKDVITTEDALKGLFKGPGVARSK
jgi:outer membrane murein-binding lipoprotein Lpp